MSKDHFELLLTPLTYIAFIPYSVYWATFDTFDIHCITTLTVYFELLLTPFTHIGSITWTASTYTTSHAIGQNHVTNSRACIQVRNTLYILFIHSLYNLIFGKQHSLCLTAPLFNRHYYNHLAKTSQFCFIRKQGSHSTWKTWKNEGTPGKPGNIMEFWKI